jgi:hypothetical protein
LNGTDRTPVTVGDCGIAVNLFVAHRSPQKLTATDEMPVRDRTW